MRVFYNFFLPLMSLFSFDVWYWKPQNELGTVPVPVCWERGMSWFIFPLHACFLVLSILEDLETFDKFSFIDAALFRSSISFFYESWQFVWRNWPVPPCFPVFRHKLSPVFFYCPSYAHVVAPFLCVSSSFPQPGCRHVLKFTVE